MGGRSTIDEVQGMLQALEEKMTESLNVVRMSAKPKAFPPPPAGEDEGLGLDMMAAGTAAVAGMDVQEGGGEGGGEGEGEGEGKGKGEGEMDVLIAEQVKAIVGLVEGLRETIPGLAQLAVPQEEAEARIVAAQEESERLTAALSAESASLSDWMERVHSLHSPPSS